MANYTLVGTSNGKSCSGIKKMMKRPMYHNEGYDKGEVVKNLCLHDTQKLTTNYVCKLFISKRAQQ